MSTAANFDRIARIYRTIERLAFGRTLQRVRLAHLERLRDCRAILLLGDGDGRALEAILRVAPDARVRSIDASQAMLALARQRAGSRAAARVTFDHADARHAAMVPSSCDAIVTQFFLDCFTPAEVDSLVHRLAAALRPGGLWLFADFAMPAHGWPRLQARVWLALLYGFFRAATGLSARKLPPSEAILESVGLRAVASSEFRHGLLRSVVYLKERDALNGPAHAVPVAMRPGL